MLIKYALVNRKVNHLMLFIYFKHIASGHIKYSNDNIKTWANDINMSERWVRDALKWMVRNKWITVNQKKKSYRIISYKQLCKQLEITSISAIIYEQDDFSEFKNVCCAAVITHYLKFKKYMDKKKNQSVSSLTDTSSSWYFYSKGFCAMPISYLARCLGVSNSTANKFKKCAIKSNLIDVRKNFRKLFDGNGNMLTIEHLPYLKEACPNMAGRLRTNGKYLSIVEADIIKSEIFTKRKRYKY
jgi:hypothetical protein